MLNTLSKSASFANVSTNFLKSVRAFDISKSFLAKPTGKDSLNSELFNATSDKTSNIRSAHFLTNKPTVMCNEGSLPTFVASCIYPLGIYRQSPGSIVKLRFNLPASCSEESNGSPLNGFSTAC